MRPSNNLENKTPSASIYESSGSQFFRTTTGIKIRTRCLWTFLIILRVKEILCSFRLVLEWKTGKEIPESSRLEFLEKFLANNFALSDRVARQIWKNFPSTSQYSSKHNLKVRICRNGVLYI